MFDQPYAVKWRQKDREVWFGDFGPDHRPINIRAVRLRLEPGWSLEFSEVPAHVLRMRGITAPDNIAPDRPMGCMAPTGRGDQFRIYATVLAVLQDLIAEVEPERVRFKGATPRQTKLYRSLMRRHADAIRNQGYVRHGAALRRRQESIEDTPPASRP